METRLVRDKKEIFDFLSGNTELQLYTIGDLDDFFWPFTKWFAIYDGGQIKSVALLYSGMNPSTLLLFFEKEPYYPVELLKSVRSQLPGLFNAHLSPGLADVFGRENIIEDWGRNFRMILTREPENISDDNIKRLNPEDIKAVSLLLETSYPDNWFDSRMLETGKYFGYFIKGTLAGIAGIHVYSPEYRIAALGNITTHPDYRGRKIAYKLTSVLCSDLRENVITIGLNVKSGNHAAIKCYQNAGFEIRSSYDEYSIKNVYLS